MLYFDLLEYLPFDSDLFFPILHSTKETPVRGSYFFK